MAREYPTTEDVNPHDPKVKLAKCLAQLQVEEEAIGDLRMRLRALEDLVGGTSKNALRPADAYRRRSA